MRDLKLDQAAGLRRLNARRNAKVIAITGGKGGVGKTLTAVNLGAALAGLGRNTMLRIWAWRTSMCCSACARA